MAHHVLVYLTLPESTDYNDTDVRDAMLARLDEVYPDDAVVPQDVAVLVTDRYTAAGILASAEVGADGATDPDAVLAALDTLKGKP